LGNQSVNFSGIGYKGCAYYIFSAASIVTDVLPAVRKISSPSSAGFFEPETGAY
jgi:hypothetical protein